MFEKKKIIRGEKAQLTVQGLLGFFVLLLVAVLVVIPIVSDVVTNATTGANITVPGETEGTLLRLFPTLIIIGLISGFFFYSSAQYQG